jgi:predicted HicB family RNase H-like nuclease
LSPNYLRLGSEAKKIAPRKGRAGNVQLRVDVPPAVKDALVTAVLDRGVSLRLIVLEALEDWIAEEAA